MNYFRSIILITIILSAKLKSFERKKKQEVHDPHRSPKKIDEINDFRGEKNIR